MKRLILASKSAARVAMLARVGVACEAFASQFDERAAEAQIVHLPAEQQALFLAKAKAADVSAQHTNTYVIGADQILECEGVVLHKAENLQQLRDKLTFLRDKTHVLHCAVCIYHNHQCVWEAVENAHITFRNFSDAELAAYIAHHGTQVLSSVGGYHYEGAGLTLMDAVHGEYHTILGMPLLALLKGLREMKGTHS